MQSRIFGLQFAYLCLPNYILCSCNLSLIFITSNQRKTQWWTPLYFHRSTSSPACHLWWEVRSVSLPTPHFYLSRFSLYYLTGCSYTHSLQPSLYSTQPPTLWNKPWKTSRKPAVRSNETMRSNKEDKIMASPSFFSFLFSHSPMRHRIITHPQFITICMYINVHLLFPLDRGVAVSTVRSENRMEHHLSSLY